MADKCDHTIGFGDIDYDGSLIPLSAVVQPEKFSHKYYIHRFGSFSFCPECGEDIRELVASLGKVETFYQ